MRCNFSALFLRGLRSQQKKEKKLVLRLHTHQPSEFSFWPSISLESWHQFFQFFHIKFLLTKRRIYYVKIRSWTTLYVVKSFVSDPFSVRQMHFECGTTFFILSILLSTLSYCLLLFLNALENCFLAQLSDLRGCIFFFPSSLLLCLLSRCIQSQYAFTLMALILILCPLAPLQLTAVTSLGESKQK